MFPTPTVTRSALMDHMHIYITKGRQCLSSGDTLGAQKHLDTVKILSETMHLVANFEASILSSNVDVD
jgi:hypothetical protein